jgi:hypothetical protein
MVMNAIDIHQERSVRLSDKASVNRRWTELFRRIEDLPEGESNLSDEENPIIDYVFGHRELDLYLNQLRKQKPH